MLGSSIESIEIKKEEFTTVFDQGLYCLGAYCLEHKNLNVILMTDDMDLLSEKVKACMTLHEDIMPESVLLVFGFNELKNGQFVCSIISNDGISHKIIKAQEEILNACLLSLEDYIKKCRDEDSNQVQQAVDHVVYGSSSIH